MELILILVLAVYVATLNRRISDLEKSNMAPSVPPVVATETTWTAPLESQLSPIPSAPQKKKGFDAVAWIKKDFLVKLGSLLLLMAFGWIVSYAFANNWIGPIGRISLGLLVGVLFMVLGVVRFVKSASQGSIFVVLGSSLVLVTVAAARELYDFFTPTTSLLIMFLAVLFVAFLSVRQNRQSLAIASLIMGAIAPLLTANVDPSFTSLSLYLLVLVLGTLWVVAVTRSAILTPLALGIVSLYSLPYIDLSFEEQLKGLLFAFVFTTIFFLGNIASMLHRTQIEFTRSHIITAFATAAYLLAWVLSAAPETWKTIVYIVWMLIFAAGAFVVYIRTNQRVPFYIFGAVAIGLLGAATVNEFSGPVLTIVLTLEVGAVFLAINLLLKQEKLSQNLFVLLMVPMFLSMEHLGSSSWREGVMHGDFFALIIITLTFFIIGLTQKVSNLSESKNVQVRYGGIILSALYGLALVWLVLHALLATDTATTLSLIIYTIIGLFLYITGRLKDTRYLRMLGGGIVGGVVLRLLLVEVWDMALASRIVTFVVIGVLLLSTAFIKKDKSHNS